MQILGSAELTEDVQNKGLCVNCGSCIGQCPYYKSYKGKVAMLFPCTMPEGRCFANCPKTEVDYERLSSEMFDKSYDGSPLGHFIEVKKGRAGVKMKSDSGYQNGGVVSALITCAMDTGMIDAAVLTGRKELVPVPVIATNVDEVLECSSSKYMAASTVASVNEYAAEGKGQLGVVGTPCQLTGVAQIRMNPLEREDFNDPVALSIGLFCTWAVDTRKFVDLVSAMTDMSKITSMDVPPPPANVMEIVSDGNKIEIPLDDIREIVPGGCAICPDMTSEFTDISVGALEGDAAYNTIIIRTEKGLKLVQEAAREGYIELGDVPAASIENLKKGAAGKKRRALIKAEEMSLLNNSQENGRSAILMKEAIVQKIVS